MLFDRPFLKPQCTVQRSVSAKSHWLECDFSCT